MLLLFSGSADGTADRIVGQLGSKVFRFNYDLFRDYEVLFSPTGWSITNPAGLAISSETATSCFWWKAYSYFPGATDRLIKAEVKYFMRDLYGWFLLRGMTKGNSPDYHNRFAKMTVLGIAMNFFRIPETAFSIGLTGLESLGRDLIVKSQSSEISDERTVMTTTAIPSLDALDPKSPWLIQDRVESTWDVTVFLCGSRLFAFKRSREGLSGVDWRTEQDFNYENQEWFPFGLTSENSKNLLSCAKELDLEFARFDFMSDRDDLTSLIFLEVNANGQWMFLDIENRYGLLEAVTDWLRS